MALEDIQSIESGLDVGAGLENSDILSGSKALDLSGVDDPFDSFSGLNLDSISDDDKGLKIETESGRETTTQTTINPSQTGKISPQERYRRLVQRGKFYDQNQASVLSQSIRPMQAYGNYEFDTYKSNVERYEAYGEKTFRELGFNPLLSTEKQEKYFNDNVGWWKDFSRMGGQFMSLSGTAFMSNYNSISNFFSGNNILDPDAQGDYEFSEANRIGSSSRGGFTGFANNLVLNSAYSLGIAANIVAEEIAIWGTSLALAPETGGASIVAGASIQAAETVSIASKINRLKTGLKSAFGLTSLGKVAKGSRQMLQGLTNADDARNFYRGLKKFGVGTVEFINPLRQTTATVRGIYRGEAAYRNISNLGKMSRGFGSFYRDMRENWFTISEAQLEGGGVRKERIDEGINDFLQKSGGVLPTGKDLDYIYQNAEAAGRVDALGNMAVIYLTNRIVFNKLFKFRGIGELVENFEKSQLKNLGNKFAFNQTTKTIERKVEEGIFKSAWKTIKSPKTLMGGGLWYMRANLAEGVQELGQEWLAGATKDHYAKIYKDGLVNKTKLLKTSVYDGLVSSVFSKESAESIRKNIFSAQGIETFASGFLMGGLIGGSKKSLSYLGNQIFNGVATAYKKWDNPQAFENYKKQKLMLEEKHLGVLNNILSNPENFFSSKQQVYHAQKTNADDMDIADDNKDAKGFHDSKDALTFEHVFDALNSGSFDTVLDGFNQLEKLTDDELADYFNIQDGLKAREKITEYKQRAASIKKKYDYFTENTPNPFNPNNFKKGSEEQVDEFIAYKAFEEAKKDAIFSEDAFERTLERMNNIYGDLLKSPPLKKISQSELSVLLNTKTIPDEMKLLRQEAELLSQSDNKLDRNIAKDKLKRAGILQKYMEALEEGDTNKLFKIYKAYLATLANEKGDYLLEASVKSSFDQILDFYSLDDDSKKYMDNINYLTNPGNLIKHSQRIRAALTELFNDKENINKEGLDNLFNIIELNGLIEELGKINIIINPAELIELYKKGTIPKTFFDIKSGKEISSTDPRVAIIKGMLGIFVNLKTKVEKVSKVTEEEKVEPEEVEKETKKEKTIDKDLQSKLEEAYNQFIDETGSDMSFDDFVATHPAAARIKSETEGGTTSTGGLGFENLGNIGNQGLAIMEADIAKKGRHVVSGISKATPEQRKKIDEDIEELRKKYPEKNFVVQTIGDTLTIDVAAASTDAKAEQLKEATGVANRAFGNAVLDAVNFPNEYRTYGYVSDISAENFYKTEFYKKNKSLIDKEIKDKNPTAFQILPTFYKDGLGLQLKYRIESEPNMLYSVGTIEVNKDDNLIKLKEAAEKAGEEYFDYLNSLEGKPETSTTSSDTEAKRADIERRRQEVRNAIKKAGQGEGGQFIVTLLDGTKENAVRLSLIGDELGIGNKGVTVDLSTIKKIENPDGTVLYDAELAALEAKGKPTTQLTQREQIAQERINEILDKVTAFRDSPSPNLNDNSDASLQLRNLIFAGDINSDEAEAAAKQKYEELLSKLQLSDFMKGDVVIFKDGRKGIVVEVNKDGLNMKMFDSPGVIEKMDNSKIKNNVVSIKNTKQAIEDEQKEPAVEVSKEDEDNMKKSQEATENLATDSKRASDAINEGIDTAGEEPPNFDDLFLGCDD